MRPARPAPGFEHLAGESIAVLTWLQANQVEFVLVGPVAEAVRGGAGATGPVAIVPAPYRRNYERLSRALDAANARPRQHGGAEAARAKAAPQRSPGRPALGVPAPASTSSTSRAARARPPATRSLLYEAGRFELAAGLNVDVASPEDIEHYAHVRRTGVSPELRITRGAQHELEHQS